MDYAYQVHRGLRHKALVSSPNVIITNNNCHSYLSSLTPEEVLFEIRTADLQKIWSRVTCIFFLAINKKIITFKCCFLHFSEVAVTMAPSGVVSVPLSSTTMFKEMQKRTTQ